MSSPTEEDLLWLRWIQGELRIAAQCEVGAAQAIRRLLGMGLLVEVDGVMQTTEAGERALRRRQ